MLLSLPCHALPMRPRADNAIEIIDVVDFNRTKWFLTDPAGGGELNPGVLVRAFCAFDRAVLLPLRAA